MLTYEKGSYNIKKQMTQMKKQWTRPLKYNKDIQNVKNGLRKFVQKDINELNLQDYEHRPQKKINLSLGDPTLSHVFRTESSNLGLVAASAITEQSHNILTQGQLKNRRSLASKYCAPSYTISQEDVYLTAGGGHALHLIALLLANPGDNFLFPAPSFPHLLTIAEISGIQPRFYSLNPEQGWQVNLEQMESLIDQKTRFIVVNDPSNPLGSCWPNDHKKAILQLCERRSIPLLADEIYETISVDRSLLTFAELSSSSSVTIFKCSGLAKRYSLPGWRVGWIILYAQEKQQQFYRKHLTNLMNLFPRPNIIAQNCIPQIINNPLNDTSMEMKVKIIQENLRILNETLDELSDYFQETSSTGAIYSAITVKLNNFNRQIGSVVDLCKLLYAQENILVLPGSLFGGEATFFRVLIACDNKTMKELCQRLKNFCEKYGL